VSAGITVAKSIQFPANFIFLVRLNASEQRELQGRMEKKQMKEFMTVSVFWY